jgi:hypothetical protein
MKGLFLIIAFCVTGGCGIITVTHEDGDLPKVDILKGNEFCDETFRAKIDVDAFLFTCIRKI